MSSSQVISTQQATAEVRQTDQKQSLTVATEMEEGSGMMARWNRNVPLIASNLDQSGVAGRALVTKALASADYKIREVIGWEMKVVGFVAHVAEVFDAESGEQQRKIRCVMVLDSGESVSTMSEPCVRCLNYLAGVLPAGKWEPPVRLFASTHQLEGGKSYVDLRELAPDEKVESRRGAKKGA